MNDYFHDIDHMKRPHNLDDFIDSVTNIENASAKLIHSEAQYLIRNQDKLTPVEALRFNEDLQEILKLAIKKEIILEFLLDEVKKCQDRRTEISCGDNFLTANLVGTAQASGNLIDGDFNVALTFTIDPNTNIGTWNIAATTFDGTTTFTTNFSAPVSRRTFIGPCSENVGPN